MAAIHAPVSSLFHCCFQTYPSLSLSLSRSLQLQERGAHPFHFPFQLLRRRRRRRRRRRMGMLFVEGLPAEPRARVFKCLQCRVDAASYDDIISKEFFGRFGRAYLFDHVVNISLGPIEYRNFITGWHTVSDIYCSCCQQIMGWKYEKAYDESQRYKEGKFILEKTRMWKEGW